MEARSGLDSKIFELKQDHENIFLSEIMNYRFIFRPLTKYEFEEIMYINDFTEEEINEQICNLCVLYPEDFNFSNPPYAGIPETLKNNIVKKSGFLNDKFVKAYVEQYMSMNEKDKTRQIENVIMFAFPDLRLSEINDWDMYKILDHYTRAKWIIENIYPDGYGESSKSENKQQQINQQANTGSVQGMGTSFNN